MGRVCTPTTHPWIHPCILKGFSIEEEGDSVVIVGEEVDIEEEVWRGDV